MAKKLINVVWKVDDSELLKSKARVNEVQAATKQAESAMSSYAAQTTKSGLVISQNLEGQKLQMAQLKAQIDLTKQTDTARLNQLKSDYEQVKKKVDDFNASMKNTQTQGQSSIGVFQNLQNTIIAAFSVAAIKQVGSMILELNTLAGKVEGVDKAFRKAFPNATILLDELRKKTHGTITDFELMQRTLQATNLGVSAEHLGVLFEFAAARAQQTGESVDYLVDSIVRGVGRKSILVLDNLGLSATRLRQQFNGASIASKSVAEVTAGVAEIAKVELEKMGGYVETSETKVKQLDVAWQTLKQNLSDRLASASIVGGLATITQGFADALAGADKFEKKLAEGKTIEEAQKSIKSFSELDKSDQTRENIFKEINARTKRIETLKDELAATSKFSLEKRATIISEITALREANNLLRDFAKSVKDPVVQQIGYIENLKNEIDSLNQAIEKSPRAGLAALFADLESKQKELKNANLLRPLTLDTNELKNDKEIERQILADANQDINDDAEKSYQEGLKILKDADLEERNEIKNAADLRNQQQKEINQAELDAERAKQAEKKRLQQAFQDFAFSSITRILQFTLIDRQIQQEDLEAHYQAEIDAAGNNAAAKKAVEEKVSKERARNEAEFQQKQIEANKDNAIKNIEIESAVAAFRALTAPPIPFSPADVFLAGLVAASALVQIGTIKSVRSNSLSTRAFADGEVSIDGPGTSTSDSIPAWLSKGESVINAKATASSRNLLEAINERKIDDNILKVIAGNGGKQDIHFDSKGIIKAIEENRLDFAQHGYTLMKAERIGSNFKRTIKSKVQGY